MSHFTTLKTNIVDAKALVAALDELGFKTVEVYEQPQNLYGYRGDQRPQTAEVIIRRKYVGRMSNDIGFKRQASGAFEAVISEFDRRKYSQTWLDGLTQRYAYQVSRARLEEQGFTLVNQENVKGQIHLVLRRVV